MESLSANEAKTHFGDLLLKVQREPVQINRNSKAVAVVLSVGNSSLPPLGKASRRRKRLLSPNGQRGSELLPWKN
jgi:prevent-host-death family protein